MSPAATTARDAPTPPIPRKRGRKFVSRARLSMLAKASTGAITIEYWKLALQSAGFDDHSRSKSVGIVTSASGESTGRESQGPSRPPKSLSLAELSTNSRSDESG